MERSFHRYWRMPLRILLGIGFMIHGAPKLFSAQGHAGFEGMLGQMGVPLPSVASWLLGILEFFGGAALIVGAAVPLVSALLAIEMLVAMLLVHLPHGFNAINMQAGPGGPQFGMPGYELNLLYIAGLLALFIGGPGPLSVDERVLKPRSRLVLPWYRESHART